MQWQSRLGRTEDVDGHGLNLDVESQLMPRLLGRSCGREARAGNRELFVQGCLGALVLGCWAAGGQRGGSNSDWS